MNNVRKQLLEKESQLYKEISDLTDKINSIDYPFDNERVKLTKQFYKLCEELKFIKSDLEIN